MDAVCGMVLYIHLGIIYNNVKYINKNNHNRKNIQQGQQL